MITPLQIISLSLVVLIIFVLVIFFINTYSSQEETEEIDEEIEDIKDYVYKYSQFLTRNERNFYEQLSEYIKDRDLLIFAQVRLADIFWVKNVKTDTQAFGMFNKIKSKHVDFVLSDLNGKILLCIELDDSTHNTPKKNDLFKDKLFDTMELRLLRYKTKHTYDFSELLA